MIIIAYIAFLPPKPDSIFVNRDYVSLKTFTYDDSSSFTAIFKTEDNIPPEELRLWFGELEFASDDPEVADLDVFTEDGAEILAVGDGSCNINITSSIGLEESISVDVQTTLRGMYEEAGCDSSWAEISDDGKSVTINVTETRADYWPDAVEAVNYFKNNLGFEDYEDNDWWGEMNPASFSYSDSNHLSSDFADCYMEFYALYHYPISWEITFTIQ